MTTATHGQTLRISRRAVTPKPHLDGGFPDTISAAWCVEEGPLHAIVAPGQQEVTLGAYVRPIIWLEPEAGWAIGSVSAGRFFEIVVDPEVSPHLHNEVIAEGQPTSVITPPAALAANLYPYQMAGFAKLSSVVSRDIGALLCDEMGLGKTVQAIALLLDQANRGQSLVVAPSSLLTNWAREIGNFAPGLRVLRHTGAARAGIAAKLAGPDVILTSYDTAINDASLLQDIDWNLLVLDEAQRIKNSATGRSQVIKSIPARATVCVTGTPVENRLTDLWSLAEAAVPQLLGSLQRFRSTYEDDEQSARALGGIVAPITVRRSVSDVAGDLPPLITENVAVDMYPLLQNLYDQVACGGGLADLTNARVVAAHAHEDPAGELAGSAKGDRTLEMLGEVFDRDEKALVFASFSRSLDQLENMVQEARPDAHVDIVDGRQNSEERQAIIDDFGRRRGPGALFLNPKAAGEGLNIVAANHVIHFNPEWNPATTRQATARAYRRKQTLPVFVHHLYYANTIEDHAMDMQAVKAGLAAAVERGHIMDSWE